MSRDTKYQWIWTKDRGGDRLYDVGILTDGTLHNPNGYPEDIVRAAVTAANHRRHDRRSIAAKKAAETRAKYREEMIYRCAKTLSLNGKPIGPRKSCIVCGKGLGDPTSIERGIGSDCWQGVLARIATIKGGAD